MIHDAATKSEIQTRRSGCPLHKNRMVLYRREEDCGPGASRPAYFLLGRRIAFYSSHLELTESTQILTWLWTHQIELI